MVRDFHPIHLSPRPGPRRVGMAPEGRRVVHRMTTGFFSRRLGPKPCEFPMDDGKLCGVVFQPGSKASKYCERHQARKTSTAGGARLAELRKRLPESGGAR